MSLVNGNEQIRGESHAQLLMRLMKELLRDEQEHPLMEMKQTKYISTVTGSPSDRI